MAELFTWRLPPELTRAILSTLSVKNERSEYPALCAAMLVCKEWKEIVQPTLLNNVRIETEVQLAAFARELHQSGLGRLVHTFCASRILPPADPATPILSDSDVEIALLHVIRDMPRLKVYRLEHVVSSRVELAPLAEAANLVTLEVKVAGDDAGIFSIIGWFKRLTCLDLTVRGTQWHQPHTDALCMPTVTHFYWYCRQLDSADMLRFLAQCSFGPALDTHIKMPQLSASKAQLLLPFLERHAFKSIVTIFSSASAGVLFPALAKAPYLELWDAPSLGTTSVTALPELLVVAYIDDSEDSVRAFWSFLEALPASFSRQRPGTHVLDIWLPTVRKSFSWTAQSDADTQFIDRLLPWAGMLYEQGVLVTDRDGHDVTFLTKT